MTKINMDGEQMNAKDASPEEMLNWMHTNLCSIDNSLDDVEWIVNNIVIADEVDSNLFMARIAKVKYHLLEYQKKQKNEYSQMKLTPLEAEKAHAKIYLLKKR